MVAAARCTGYETPLNFVEWRRFQSPCRETLSPELVVPMSDLGMTVKAQRTPVNPAVLLKLRNSIATSRAPGISKIECGISGLLTYASYAASYRMIARFARA